MEWQIIYYQDTTPEEWDRWVDQIDEATYAHSSLWLRYCCCYPYVRHHLSFAVFGQGDRPVGICPLAVTAFPDKEQTEFTFSGIPLGVPAVVDLEPSQRRKVWDLMFDTIRSLARQYQAQKMHFVYHSLNKGSCLGQPLSQKNSFEILRYGLLLHVNNTTVVDLTLPAEVLLQRMSKYHRRHIMRSEKKGITVKIFNSQQNRDDLPAFFARLQQAHFISAGRVTRPQATWDAMLEGAEEGKASLVVAFLNDEPMSFLFCGEFSRMAFGWSQVNVEEFEKDYNPRHLLEWEAMRYYKSRDFRYYEVGEVFYTPQIFRHPTPKDLSISVFKLRYGGFLLPRLAFFGYFDPQLMKEELTADVQRFFQSWDQFLQPDKETVCQNENAA